MYGHRAPTHLCTLYLYHNVRVQDSNAEAPGRWPRVTRCLRVRVPWWPTVAIVAAQYGEHLLCCELRNLFASLRTKMMIRSVWLPRPPALRAGLGGICAGTGQAEARSRPAHRKVCRRPSLTSRRTRNARISNQCSARAARASLARFDSEQSHADRTNLVSGQRISIMYDKARSQPAFHLERSRDPRAETDRTPPGTPLFGPSNRIRCLGLDLRVILEDVRRQVLASTLHRCRKSLSVRGLGRGSTCVPEITVPATPAVLCRTEVARSSQGGP